MRAVRLAPWIVLGILLSSGCHGSVVESARVDEQPTATTQIEKPTTTEVGERPSSTAKPAEQPTATTKVEECSWCPAPDPSGTTAPHQAASTQADLTDQLQAAAAGTVFADISEDQLLADIRAICEAWKGDTSLGDAAARVSQARAELLGASESEPELTAYTQLLETSADRRCLRDPTR